MTKKLFSQKKLSFLIALVITLSLFSSSPTSTAIADISKASDEPSCWPLDIVLLMDQSLSIFNNDPDSYRAIAANRILALLISNRRAQCPKAVHRVGLIAFGDRADTILDLVPIDIGQDVDREEWLRNRGYPAAIEEAAQDRTQKATDFEVAFGKAEELFDKAPHVEDPLEYGLRRRVVILLTDGNPDGIGNVSDYMCDLSEYLNGATWDTTSIWVMALNASGGPYLGRQGCKATIRSDWESITQGHSGNLLDVEYNEQTIPAYMKDIIDAEFGQPGIPLPCGDFYVDPYLRQVQFTFQKNLEDEERPVILEKLDTQGDSLYRYRGGEIVEPSIPSDMVFRDDLYYNRDLAEVYIFEYPLPGKWRFEVAGLTDEECEARVEARENREEITVELSQPENIIDLVSDPPYYGEDTPALEVHIWNKDQKAPFESDKNYPLEVIANLKLPSGNTTLPDGSPLPTFDLSESKPGIWISDDPMLAPEIGQHTLTVVGKSKDGEGNFGYGVFTDTVTYEVLKRDQLSFKITSPEEGADLRCNTVQDGNRFGVPIPVNVQLLDADGRPAPGGEYLDSDLDQSFQATLLDVNNVELDKVALNASSEETGLFEGTLLANQSEVKGCGKAVISTLFNGEYNIRRFTMPITRETTSVSRQVVQGVQLEVVPEKPKERLLLHPNLWAARPGGHVSKAPIEFKLKDLNGEELDPTSVAAGSPENLYRIELFGPIPELYQVITPTLEQKIDGAVFAATGGLTMTEPGDYNFRITAQPDAFSDGYMPADEDTLSVEFERYDTFMTHPTTALVVIIVMTLFLLIIIGLITYNLTGGPGGTIKFSDHETGKEIDTLSLSKARFFSNVIGTRSSKLKKYKIKVIKARKTKPLEGKRAALITMIATEDGEILLNDEPFESGETKEVILPGDLDSIDLHYF